MDIDKLIEEIVYMIFECEVDKNDPSETIEQVKARLYNEGLYSYKNK
jgi:hypothetical protein